MYEKRKKRQVEDAFRQAAIIRKEYHREPTLEEMKAFYSLFLERKENILVENNIRTNISGDVEEEIISDFYTSNPVFKGYKDFLEKSKSYESNGKLIYSIKGR